MCLGHLPHLLCLHWRTLTGQPDGPLASGGVLDLAPRLIRVAARRPEHAIRNAGSQLAASVVPGERSSHPIASVRRLPIQLDVYPLVDSAFAFIAGYSDLPYLRGAGNMRASIGL